MNLSWKDLSPIFARLGMPIIAWALDKLPAIAGEAIKGLPFGGLFSGVAESGVRLILTQLVKAVGLDPATATPDDVKMAVEQGPTSEIMANLQAVEAKAASMTALVELFKSDNVADVEMAKVNSDTFLANRRADAASNDPVLSSYRPILLFGSTFALLYLIGLILYAATVGGTIVDNVMKMENLLMAVFTALVGALLGHFVTRASERKALLAPLLPTQQASTTTTVVMPPAAVTKPKAKR